MALVSGNVAMFSSRSVKVLAALTLSLTLFVAGCGSAPPSKYDKVQKETTTVKKNKSVAKEAVQGSKFNKFFPKASGDLKTIPSQEKKGFAEYKLNKGTKTLAMFAISDTASEPSAAAKFKNSAKKISGYPAVEQGSTATAVLVADRFQAKVLSRDTSFTKSDRETWLKKFDLDGLARVK